MDELCFLQHLLWVCPSPSTLDGKASEREREREMGLVIGLAKEQIGESQESEREGGGDSVVAVVGGGKESCRVDEGVYPLILGSLS